MVSPQGHRSVSVRRQVFLHGPRSALDRYGNGPGETIVVVGETRLPDCGVIHQVGSDRGNRLPGFPPLTVDVDRMSDVVVVVKDINASLHQLPKQKQADSVWFSCIW